LGQDENATQSHEQSDEVMIALALALPT